MTEIVLGRDNPETCNSDSAITRTLFSRQNRARRLKCASITRILLCLRHFCYSRPVRVIEAYLYCQHLSLRSVYPGNGLHEFEAQTSLTLTISASNISFRLANAMQVIRRDNSPAHSTQRNDRPTVASKLNFKTPLIAITSPVLLDEKCMVLVPLGLDSPCAAHTVEHFLHMCITRAFHTPFKHLQIRFQMEGFDIS